MPDFAALKSAARAAIVMPAVFAFADKVIGQPQTSLFAAFGSFAMLVLVEFEGPPRARFLAYLGLAGVGVSFITLGTLCSRNPWLAAGVMAVVGFVTLFSGLISGYFAAGATSAILLFILPVTIPAPNSAIPERLEGWGLAVGAGICAVMLLWPPAGDRTLHEAAGALRAVADFLDVEEDGPADPARLAAERSTLSADACSAPSIAPPAPPARQPRSPRFPTSSTGSSRYSRPRLSCRRSSSPAKKTRKRWRPRRACFAQARRDSKAVAGGPILRASIPRETRLRTPSCDACPSYRRTSRQASSHGRSRGRFGSGRQRIPPVRSPATPCSLRGRTHRSSIAATSRSRRRPVPRSRRRSSSQSSTRACAPCGSRTASAAPPASPSPSTSPSERVSSTGSGSCSERSPCCGRTRSAPAGRFSARSWGPRSESSSVRCS